MLQFFLLSAIHRIQAYRRYRAFVDNAVRPVAWVVGYKQVVAHVAVVAHAVVVVAYAVVAVAHAVALVYPDFVGR